MTMRFGKFIAALIAALTLLACPVECYAAEDTPEKAVGAAIPERYLKGKELELYQIILQNVKAISEGKQGAESFYPSVSPPFKSKIALSKTHQTAL